MSEKDMSTALSLEKQLIEDRRALHRIPECGVDLPQTTAYVKSRLDRLGVKYRDCGKMDDADRNALAAWGYKGVSECSGILAEIGTGQSPCILLRGDMDALPVHETTGLDFASPGNTMHACGHDTHTAMLLGAAAILKGRESSLKGTVKLMFQPGEEVAIGARAMINDGALENPKVDAAFAMHNGPYLPPGKAIYCLGESSGSLDTYALKIKGKGAHSSQPHLGIDPLMIVQQIYQALNTLLCRETDPAAFATLNCGVIHGGAASNVIPDEADLTFGFRTLNADTRNHLLKRIPQIVDATVKMWRGTYTCSETHLPCTVCDIPLTKTLLPFIEEVLGEGSAEVHSCLGGAEDFAYVSEKVPSFLLYLGSGGEDTEQWPPLHNPGFHVDEKFLAQGAAVYANCAVQWLKQYSA
ncbi:MAG: amidohydrolase [Spirochaetaceae bacterium]|jgi:amidohydrolase|nr:amidohydrolase [Spirochaetaceae bacterium]